MNLSRNSYNHIKSFEDFENEKMKLFYQIKLSERKLELKYFELTSFLNPIRFVPFLISAWLGPVLVSFKNMIVGFFTNRDKKQSDNQESEEKSKKT